MLLVNKPKGWTSFDVVAKIRGHLKRANCHPEEAQRPKDPLHKNHEILRCRLPAGRQAQDDKPKRIRVGHAGTLDPFATGLLIVAVGREETKKLDEFKNLPKKYVATIHLGATSDTMDGTGRIEDYKIKRLKDSRLDNNETMKQFNNLTYPNIKDIESTLNSFKGKQLQTPPMYSAKKINGQRLYKLARKGKTIERQPSEIEILDIKILEYSYPLLKIEVTCSAGTYIRTLAEDIGKKLGTGAYCEELERTKIGEHKLEDAKKIEEIDFKNPVL